MDTRRTSPQRSRRSDGRVIPVAAKTLAALDQDDDVVVADLTHKPRLVSVDAPREQPDRIRSAEEYWSRYTLGRLGRPPVGALLVVTADYRLGRDGSSTGTVLPYDPRWHCREVPVLLDESGTTILVSVTEARNAAGQILRGKYELLGATLSSGADLVGTHRTADGQRQQVTLLAGKPGRAAR